MASVIHSFNHHGVDSSTTPTPAKAELRSATMTLNGVNMLFYLLIKSAEEVLVILSVIDVVAFLADGI